MTDIQEFEQSITDNQPPAGLSVFLQSLWYDAKGDWNKAHSLIDSLTGSKAATVHAYLHRVEGDNRNADYWYKKAGKKMPDISVKEEWKELVTEFLQHN